MPQSARLAAPRLLVRRHEDLTTLRRILRPRERMCRIPTLLAVLVLLVVTADLPAWEGGQRDVVHGPYALLLASSTDLGPAQSNEVQLTAALRDARRPEALIEWAQSQRSFGALATR